MAAAYGRTVGQLAIAWVLMQPAVTSAIVGARKPGQVHTTLGGAGWQISPQDMGAIEQYLREHPLPGS
jgi:aryl-alcohol dehydrogenase-like predicted oxidoreductase